MRKYGKPLTANVAVDSDLPGGLGGSFDNATASISAAGDGVKGETRYRIVSPEGTVVAELWFAVTSTKGLDGTGVYVKRRDTSGTVLIEGHFDATDRSGKIEFTFIEVARPGVTEIAPAVEFISNLSQPKQAPNCGQIRSLPRPP